MRLFVVLFILSHFIAFECWAKDKELINELKRDIKLNIPLIYKKEIKDEQSTNPNYSVNFKYHAQSQSNGLYLKISF